MFQRMAEKSKIKAFLTSPLVHFFLLGSLIFLLQQGPLGAWLGRKSDGLGYEIHLSQARINEAKREFLNQWGRQPDSGEVQEIANQVVEEEILFRQAKRYRLDQNHPGIRRRLIQLGEYLGEASQGDPGKYIQNARTLGLDQSDPVIRRQMVTAMKELAGQMPLQGEKPIGEADLKKYLSEHPDHFHQGMRLDFIHLFIRGKESAARGRLDLLAKKISRDSLSPEAAVQMGDPFLNGREFSQIDSMGVQKFFGSGFFEQVEGLPEGRWSLPIASSYGWHLVYVKKRYPERPLELARVWNQIFLAVARDRQQQRLQSRMALWKGEYSISVEGGGG